MPHRIFLAGKSLRQDSCPGEQESHQRENQSCHGGAAFHEAEGGAAKIPDGIDEFLTCCELPSGHLARIRTGNEIERLNRDIRRTRMLDSFPNGNSNSALMLVRAMWQERNGAAKSI